MTKSTEKLTNAELHQIIGSHEKGWAMIVPINYGYLAAKELLAVRGKRQAGTSKIIEIAAELARGNLLGALWEEAEKSKNIRTERLQQLLENAGEAMKYWATQLKQTCERTGHRVLAVPQTDHLKRAINLAKEAKELAYRIRADELAPPAPALPDEIKQVLLWALWHHLGGCSSIGQPIRKFLGMGANERMTDEQLITAKAYPASVAEKRVISDSWIACSDRMPTDETTVLVSNEENVVWIADVDHGGQLYPDEFPVAKMSAGEITHWMPIPAAPTPTK